MAARINGFFDNKTRENIEQCKLLVVGAGGIGCELLKTLVLTGFEDIHVIDLDTIDLSNLNRQFLFHKQHIGKPKAIVAKESVLKFNPKANIIAYHDSITKPEYNVKFYQQFTAVANALDNVAARSHVNRMCMAAKIPLIESGSAGYLGQTTVYKRNETECYECTIRAREKQYPSCTIRNTPSEPVHCIVWAKHLFSQLFGEADEEVSPDVESANSESGTENIAPTERVPTRELALSTSFNPNELFQKLFNEDILYLHRMEHLWENRVAPVPLKFGELLDAVPGGSQSSESEISDFRVWSLKECGNVFVKSLAELRKRVEEGGPDTILVWDKDDDVCLDFVAACSNLRSHCFHIQQKNRFDVKAIAGNIVPAIATTNAIVSGLIVLQLMKVLTGDLSKCRTSWINATYLGTSKLISSGQLEKPNPKCSACSTETAEVTIEVNMEAFTLRTLEDKILKEKLHMVQPDAFLSLKSGTILISSDPEEMEDVQYEKTFSDFKVESHSKITCEDFLQDFHIYLVVVHNDKLSGQDFEIISPLDAVMPEKAESDAKKKDGANNVQDNDECLMDTDADLEPELEIVPADSTVDDENGTEPPAKKLKV